MNTEKEIYRSDEAWAILNEERRQKPPKSFLSHLPSLNAYIEDFRSGEITVISGKTGHGKTLLAMSLTKSMSEQGLNALWFSYELAPYDFLEKTIKQNGTIPNFYLPLHLIPNKLDYVDFKIKEAKKLFTLHAVFVDHLHFLCDSRDIRLTVEIGKVMRWLKSCAIKHEVAIFLIAHIAKLQDVKVSDLDNDHLKDASSIAQDSDNVFFVIRLNEDNLAKLKITKNRRRGVRGKIIDLIKVGNFLEEKDYIHGN